MKIKNFKSIFLLTLSLLGAQTSHAEKARLALIGDSTMATFGESSKIRGWGEFLAYSFNSQKIEVKNFAVAGRSSKTFISEGYLSQVLSYRPQFVMIDLGINDASRSSAGYTTPAQYAQNLAYMATRLRNQGANVIFVNPHTLNVYKNGAFGDDGLKDYRASMSQVAKNQKNVLLNLYARTKARFNQLGKNATQALFVDTVHFNKTGASQAAALVVDELRHSTNQLKLYLR